MAGNGAAGNARQILGVFHGRGERIDDLKMVGESHGIERLVHSGRYLREDHFAPMMALIVALGVCQGTKPRTGHILQLAHIENQMIAAVLRCGIQRLSEVYRFGTIHPAAHADHLNNFCMLPSELSEAICVQPLPLSVYNSEVSDSPP